MRCIIHNGLVINKTLNKGNREEKRKDQSPNKRQHSKAQMHNWEP